MTSDVNITRRTVLKAAAAAGGLALVGGWSGGGAGAVSRAARRTLRPGAFEGVTLRMIAQSGTAYEPALLAWADEFKEATGATVEFDWTPWESLLPKVQTAMTAPGSVDLFLSDIEFQYSVYPELVDLAPLIEESGYDTAGWFNSVRDYGAGIGGDPATRWGLPLTAATPIVLYRVSSAGDVPATWEDFDAFIEAQTGDGKYGLACAGLVPAALLKQFLPRLRGLGGTILSPEWEPLINSAEGVAALEMLRSQAEFMAPGYLSWDDAAAAQAFLNGDAAVLETWSSFIMPKIDDPAASKVVGEWTVAPLPGNPAGHFTQHNAIIFNDSSNQEAAFEFASFITGPEKAVELMLDYREDSARETAWQDEAVLADRPYLSSLAPALDVAKPFARGLPSWLEIFLALGDAVQAGMSGATEPQAALDEAADKWREIIDRDKPDFPYVD